MFKDLPIKYLLVAGLVIAGILPLLTLSLLSYETAKTELVNAAFNQLESVRKIKSTQISSYFEEKSLQLQHLAKSPYLQQLFQTHLNQDDARNYLLDYCQHHQLDNIFLLDAATGVTILSARESTITASPIQSSLRDVWKNTRDGAKIALSDTTLYSDDAAEPVQFMATGVYKKSKLRAVLVSQLSVMAIDRIMRERSGMGTTGETYLAGRDYRMRSDSYLDPIGHSVVASLKGTLNENGVDTVASRTALAGNQGKSPLVDYNGNVVLSSYGPIDFFGLRWAVIAEIDEAEINATIDRALNSKVLSIIVFSLLLLVSLAFGISLFIEKGIRNVLCEIKRLIDQCIVSRHHVYLDKNTIPKDFEELALKINNLISVFYEHVVEKEKLEQSIYYNQRLESVGALASAISHDFNNVLTYMYTYADLILEELDQNSLEHQRAQELIFAIDHATALTEQISLFSRNVKREMKPTSFSKVLAGSMKLMVPTFQRRINVIIINPEEDLMVLADQTSLHQIIINLCTNAYHALIDHGDKLEIQLKSRVIEDDVVDGLSAGEYAYLCISDNGKGMPLDVLDKIFEPYFTTKANGQGSGMGLTIVYRLVSNLQGKIWAESVVSKGTVFHLLIPLIK